MAKSKREKDIEASLYALCQDKSGLPPQEALHELCRYFLGDDWYCWQSSDPNEVNAYIVKEIENKYIGYQEKKELKNSINAVLKAVFTTALCFALNRLVRFYFIPLDIDPNYKKLIVTLICSTVSVTNGFLISKFIRDLNNTKQPKRKR